MHLKDGYFLFFTNRNFEYFSQVYLSSHSFTHEEWLTIKVAGKLLTFRSERVVNAAEQFAALLYVSNDLFSFS